MGVLLISGMVLAAALQPVEPPPVTYPAPTARAAYPEDFAPPGWAVEREVRGELNGDSVEDVLLILRARDPANLIEHDGMGASPWDTNPRMLVVGFGRAEGGFDRAVADHTLIPRPESPNLEDVLAEASAPEIRNRAFRISLRAFASAGSWSMGTATFTFRWRDGAFRLIGFDDTWIHRGSGDVTERSVNYLTGRMSRAEGSIEDDVLTPVWSAAPAGPLLRLEDIGDGLAFDPEAR